MKRSKSSDFFASNTKKDGNSSLFDEPKTINDNVNTIPPFISTITKKQCHKKSIIDNNYDGRNYDNNEGNMSENNNNINNNIIPSVQMKESSTFHSLQLDKKTRNANMIGSTVAYNIAGEIDVSSDASSQLSTNTFTSKSNGKKHHLVTEYDDEMSKPKKRAKTSKVIENDIIDDQKKSIKESKKLYFDIYDVISIKNNDNSDVSLNLSLNEKSTTTAKIYHTNNETRESCLDNDPNPGDKVLHHWDTLGKLHTSSAKLFRWGSSPNTTHDGDSGNKNISQNQNSQENSHNLLHHDFQLGRVYFSSFFFKEEPFHVGDFVSSSIPVGEGDEIYRIVGAFQALKSFVGAWQKKDECSDEIQKRGHPYALVVPLCCEKHTKFYKDTYDPSQESSSQTTPKKMKKLSVEQYIPLHNELFLDSRRTRDVDVNNIYKLPVWLGDSSLTMKKINVRIISPPLDKGKFKSKYSKKKELNSNQYVLMHCFRPPPRSKQNKTRKAKINLLPLKIEQCSILTSSAKCLKQKYLPTTWDARFSSKQVQFVKTERKHLTNISNKNIRKRCDKHDKESDKVPFHLNYSSDESHTEAKQEDFNDCLLFYSQNEHFQYRLPFLNVDGYEILDSNSKNPNYQSLKNFELITNRNEIDSIDNDNRIDLHKVIINRNEYIRTIYGFPDFNNVQKTMCYKANLKFDLIFHNFAFDDITLPLILPSLFQIGITIIIGNISENFKDQLNQIKISNKRSSKIEVLDLDSLVGERRGPAGALASISNKFYMNEFDSRIIIYTATELATSKKIIKELQRIKNMRMLTRLVFNEIDTESIIEICTCLPTVPFTSIWMDTNSTSSIQKLANHSESIFREKPILFSRLQKTVGYFVERKINFHQVSIRIVQILKSFVEEDFFQDCNKIDKNDIQNDCNKSYKKFPKFICYCVDKKYCENMKQILNKNLDICAEIITDRGKKCDRTLNGFQNGEIQAICLTKAIRNLNDIPDIRFAFHISSASSIDDYESETECVGQDGEPSFCILFSRLQEHNIEARLLNTNDKDDRLRAMLNYCVDGNIDLCRRVMLGHVAIQDQITNKKQDLFFNKFCCDHCQMRKRVDGQLFPQRELRSYTESNHCPQLMSLSKLIDVNWLVEESLKSIQANNTKEFNVYEFKHHICNIISKKIAEIHQMKKKQEKKSLGRQMDGHMTNETDMQLLFNVFKFKSVKKCLANDLDILLQHFGLFVVQFNPSGNKLYDINVERVTKALLAMKDGILKFKVQSLPEFSKDISFSRSFYDEIKGNNDDSRSLIESNWLEAQEKYDVFDKDDKMLLQYMSSYFGIGTPSLKMPQIIEARWLTYLPFIVNYEICRIFNNYNIDESKFCKELLKKIRDPSWNWHEYDKVNEFFSNTIRQSQDINNSHEQPEKNFVNKGNNKKNVKILNDRDLKYTAHFGRDGSDKLTLLPAVVGKKKKGRIFRKFGYHRFLFVQVHNARLHHLERIRLVPHPTEELWICGRRYSFLWADKFASPQIYVLFAEKGIEISKEEELSVEDVRNWCVPTALNFHLTRNQAYDFFSYNFIPSVPTVTLPSSYLEEADDIIEANEGSCMTYGFGLISRHLINYIWDQSNRFKISSHEQECPHSSFFGQIGGIRGFWLLDPSIGNGFKLIYRKSQYKYNLLMKSIPDSNFAEARNQDLEFDDLFDTLEVIKWHDGPSRGHLTPNMVQMLEHKGVSHETLLRFIQPIVHPATEKVQFFVQESQYLHYIPDHTQLLNQGEAFITAFENFNVENVVVMPKQVYCSCNLLKLRLVSYSELFKRSTQCSTTSKECNMHYCSTLCDEKEKNKFLHCFFKEMKKGYIVINSKGKKNACFMMDERKCNDMKVWVCWEKCLVDEINEQSKEDCIAVKSVRVHTKDEAYTMSPYDRFLDAWLYRNYQHDIYNLQSLLNTMIDLYGFGKSETVLISKHIFQLTKEPTHVCEVPDEVATMINDIIKEKGIPHWNAKKSDLNLYQSKSIIGVLWDKIQQNLIAKK